MANKSKGIDKEQFEKLLNEGKSKKEIRAILGVGDSTLSIWIADNYDGKKFTDISSLKAGRPVTNIDKAKFENLCKAQATQEEICQALGVCQELVFRHPHIYGDKTADNPEEVSKIWEQVKQKEKDGNKTVLSGVPKSLPSLIKAYRIQDKARNVGFDWKEREDVWEKVFEEIGELKKEFESGNKESAEKELGDVLFSLVNAARLYHINPDTALEQTNRKFISRFGYVEEKAKEMGRNIKELTLEEMDRLWNEAKNVLLCVMTVLVVISCTNTTKPSADVEEEIVEDIDSALYGKVGDATSMHLLTVVSDAGQETAIAMNQDTVPSDVQGGLYAGDLICVTTISASRPSRRPSLCGKPSIGSRLTGSVSPEVEASVYSQTCLPVNI